MADDTVYYTGDHEARVSTGGGYDLYCGGEKVVGFISSYRKRMQTTCRRCRSEIHPVEPPPGPEPEMEFGTEPHKLHRTADPGTSAVAAHSIDSSRLERLVFDTIDAAGPRGIIQDDLLDQYPLLSYSSLTARPSALIRKDMIVRLAEKREGKSGRLQSVLVSARHAGDRP